MMITAFMLHSNATANGFPSLPSSERLHYDRVTTRQPLVLAIPRRWSMDMQTWLYHASLPAYLDSSFVLAGMPARDEKS